MQDSAKCCEATKTNTKLAANLWACLLAYVTVGLLFWDRWISVGSLHCRGTHSPTGLMQFWYARSGVNSDCWCGLVWNQSSLIEWATQLSRARWVARCRLCDRRSTPDIDSDILPPSPRTNHSLCCSSELLAFHFIWWLLWNSWSWTCTPRSCLLDVIFTLYFRLELLLYTSPFFYSLIQGVSFIMSLSTAAVTAVMIGDTVKGSHCTSYK